MSLITGSEESRQVERADETRSQTREDHHEGHSMMRHMLWCALGMVTAVVVSAAFGINVAPVFCAAMMIAMVWMMAGPAVGKLHNRDHVSQ